MLSEVTIQTSIDDDLRVICYRVGMLCCCFFFSSRRRHTRSDRDWSSDVCSSDLFLRVSLHLLRRFPVYVAFPRSEYYQQIRLPLQHLPFSGMVHVVRHTQLAYAPSQDRSGSLRFLNASFSEPAVLSDPAAVSSHLASSGDLLLPSSHYDSVG